MGPVVHDVWRPGELTWRTVAVAQSPGLSTGTVRGCGSRVHMNLSHVRRLEAGHGNPRAGTERRFEPSG